MGKIGGVHIDPIIHSKAKSILSHTNICMMTG